MLFFEKKIKEYRQNLKGLGAFAMGGFFISIFAIILLSKSIHAQMGGLYAENSSNAAAITSLMSAVVSNDIEGVKFFSKAGESIVNRKNIGGATALHIACRTQKFEIVKILIKN